MTSNDVKNIQFPAEWHEQDAILLTWPHAGTDWAPYLEEVEETYVGITREILKEERVVIVCPEPERLIRRFSGEEREQLILCRVPSNDTWSRDHGPLCTRNNGTPVLNDFRFNGWGNKYHAVMDDQITGKLFQNGIFLPEVRHCEIPGFVLEGGSIDTDGAGTLLTTSTCLLHSGRNGAMTKPEIERILHQYLGVTRILWLDHGHLDGDDTDGHIDTLARFCDEDTLCYIRCSRPEDSHSEELGKMESCLRNFRTRNGQPYRLVPLPLPSPVYSDEGRRLPATYANFLILNNSVLMPVYGLPEDREALAILSLTFPGRRITAIDCRILLEQNGSLHCMTMQIPKGFLRMVSPAITGTRAETGPMPDSCNHLASG